MNTARDLRNFADFPGEIQDDGMYHFPELYSTDAKGKTRIWKIIIRLVKLKSKMPKHGIDWNMLDEDQMPIKSEYLGDILSLPTNSVAQFWHESGIIDGKITRHAPSYGKPTNVGKKNYRDSFKSALIKARQSYMLKVDKGFKPKNEYDNPIEMKHSKFYPMLARKLNEAKEWKYPCYIQPKLDGLRSIVYLAANPRSGTPNDVCIYSRSLKEIMGFEALREELYPILVDMYNHDADESLYLDGEFYKHGLQLQDINGIVRNIVKNRSQETVPLHIFDVFYPSQISMIYKDRLQILNNLFAMRSKWQTVVRVPTQTAKTEGEADEIYEQYIADNYEGAMYKSINAPYLTSSEKTSTELRSRDVLKRKKEYTEEFEVVDYTEGTKGKDVGAIVWICQTTDGKQFHVTPNVTYEERYKLFKEAKKKFGQLYEGRMLMVKFQDWSKDGKPLRAKGLIFRDE